MFKDGNAERCFCSFRRVNFWYSDITFGVIDTGKPHANREQLNYCRLRWNQHSEQPNTPAMDQYCFLLTGSDWSQTDMRFQDENSRCLLWRRMSSNRAVHPLMKPTGRQRHRNQRLHSPTHLTWLERLNWRAGDCGCSSSCRCWCLRSLLHWSPAVLKWFPFQQLCGLQNFRLDAYSWWAHVNFNDCLPRILMPYKLEGFYHPAHGKSYSWTNYDFLSLFHICCWTVKINTALPFPHTHLTSL